MSKVYFADLRTNSRENLLDKFQRLVKAAGIDQCITRQSLCAVKLHFGEWGNLAYIRPVFLRVMVELLDQLGTRSFLTDTNTLYVGTRSDAANHLITAQKNGFGFSCIGAPVIIADGLRGQNEVSVTIAKKHFHKVYLGGDIVAADHLVVMSHVKGHELTGIGGTIKNLAMGCASRRGKLAQHSTLGPTVNEEKCEGCALCVDHCRYQAITVNQDKARINGDRCVKCAYCILVCPSQAITVNWKCEIRPTLEKIAEYALGVLQDKKDHAFFVNFLTNISPACDCYGYNDTPIVPDIGILASRDPVAIDRAAADLINAQTGLRPSALKTAHEPHSDKFKDLYPHVPWEHGLIYAEKLGLGSNEYERINI